MVSQAISFKVAQHTNKLSSKPATEEQFHSLTLPLSRQPTNWSKNLRADQDLEPTLIDPVFSVAASSNTPVTYAQPHLRFATVVTKVINSQASVNRLPTTTETSDLPSRWEHMRVVEHEKHSYTLLEEGIQYKNCFTLACTSTHWCTYDGPTL